MNRIFILFTLLICFYHAIQAQPDINISKTVGTGDMQNI